MKAAALALTLSIAALAGSLAAAQQPQATPEAKAQGPQFAWPERMANPQVLPADTPPERLRETMRRFAMSLGVRCSHCHVGTEGQPLSTFDFASDANPKKNVARAMMRMAWRLNTEDLPAIAGLSEPRIGCFTCHRGSVEPPADPPPPAAQ
jgi:hypothetical protein